jgi:hypothetical protein
MVRYRDKRGRKQIGFVCAAKENDALRQAVKLFGMAIISIFQRL